MAVWCFVEIVINAMNIGLNLLCMFIFERLDIQINTNTMPRWLWNGVHSMGEQLISSARWQQCDIVKITLDFRKDHHRAKEKYYVDAHYRQKELSHGLLWLFCEKKLTFSTLKIIDQANSSLAGIKVFQFAETQTVIIVLLHMKWWNMLEN